MSSPAETPQAASLGPVVGAFVFGLPLLSIFVVAIVQHWGR